MEGRQVQRLLFSVSFGLRRTKATGINGGASSSQGRWERQSLSLSIESSFCQICAKHSLVG